MNHITKEQLIKISDYCWEIPVGTRPNMRVPARVFATEKMLEEVFGDKTLTQLANVATLQGIVGNAMVMPDGHEGYGFPIGGVAAMAYPDGIISPGGIGYDINCGVRLLRSTFAIDDIKNNLASLCRELYHWIPSGVGRGGQLKLERKDLDDVLVKGVMWMLEHDYGNHDDFRFIESHGVLSNADPSKVSDHAKKRGHDQLGTIGAGNHFVEVGFVDQIYDEQAARAFGLKKDQVTVLIHTGSRGFGHQIATDYIKLMMNVMANYG